MADFDDDDREKSRPIDSGDHSDDHLQAEINRRIASDRFLSDKNIQVVVYQGVVTLRGTLPTTAAGDRLLDLVSSTPGVRGINQDLLAIGDEALPDHPEGQFTGQPGRTVDAVIPTGIPVTGEEADIISDDAVAMMHAVGNQAPEDHSGDIQATDQIAASISEGMEVVDADGKKVGKVKQVRVTDFYLDRGLLARDYYVPYEAVTLQGDKVALKIPAGELSRQGWAVPGRSSDPNADPFI